MTSLTSSTTLLNSHHITKYLLAKKISTPFNIHLFTSIDSTNRFLKDLPMNHAIDICCAEMQTAGRGRFGRYWHSPFGENIYCSSRWNLNFTPAKFSGLSLVTSLAILATLDELNVSTELKIKWPNDIYWNDKKLCGTLIETFTEANGKVHIIVGIGLNVNTDTQKHPLPEKPWCSLYEITQQYFDRNVLVAALIYYLQHYFNKFINNDLNAFMDEWQQADYLAGKYINVEQSTGSLSGKSLGINALGQLILQDATGMTHLLSSGDTSLKLT